MHICRVVGLQGTMSWEGCCEVGETPACLGVLMDKEKHRSCWCLTEPVLKLISCSQIHSKQLTKGLSIHFSACAININHSYRGPARHITQMLGLEGSSEKPFFKPHYRFYLLERLGQCCGIYEQGCFWFKCGNAVNLWSKSLLTMRAVVFSEGHAEGLVGDVAATSCVLLSHTWCFVIKVVASTHGTVWIVDTLWCRVHASWLTVWQ